MPTFAMLTRLAPGAAPNPVGFEHLERHVMERVGSECPEVKWTASYAAAGRYDYLDIFEAPDVENAMRVGVLMRAFGYASTEIMPILEWKRFKRLVEDMQR
jgi:uncharacterized protein with GYD domain